MAKKGEYDNRINEEEKQPTPDSHIIILEEVVQIDKIVQIINESRKTNRSDDISALSLQLQEYCKLWGNYKYKNLFYIAVKTNSSKAIEEILIKYINNTINTNGWDIRGIIEDGKEQFFEFLGFMYIDLKQYTLSKECWQAIIKVYNHFIQNTLGKAGYNYKDKYYFNTSLIKAVKEGRVDIVRGLLRHPWIDINKKYQGKTAIEYAVTKGREKILGMLLKKREEEFKPPLIDKPTILKTALKVRNIKIIEMLSDTLGYSVDNLKKVNLEYRNFSEAAKRVTEAVKKEVKREDGRGRFGRKMKSSGRGSTFKKLEQIIFYSLLENCLDVEELNGLVKDILKSRTTIESIAQSVAISITPKCFGRNTYTIHEIQRERAMSVISKKAHQSNPEQKIKSPRANALDERTLIHQK